MNDKHIKGGAIVAGFKARAGAEADIAYHLEQSPTLLAGNNDASVVIAQNGYSQAAYDKFISDEKSATLKAQGGSYGGGSETLVVDTKGFPLGFRAENTRLYDEKATTLCSGTRPGFCNGVVQAKAVDCRNATEADINGALQSSSAHNINSNNTVRHYTVVRRLTPLECERLQGFPDGWTQIGEPICFETYTDEDGSEFVSAVYEYIDENGKKKKTNDGARYKALGNSIAIPPWFYVLMKLNLCCGVDNTMASLFDGIGGFPLIWEMLNGTGSCLWASEIEDFPIAVTKTRFYEEDA